MVRKVSPPLARKWWGFLSNTSQGARHGVSGQDFCAICHHFFASFCLPFENNCVNLQQVAKMK
jgi:hypothetical protein